MLDRLSYENNTWSREKYRIKPRLGAIKSSRMAYIIFSSMMFGSSFAWHEFPQLQFGTLFFSIIGYMGAYNLGIRAKRVESTSMKIENIVFGDDDYQLEKREHVIRLVYSLKSDASRSCWMFWTD